MFIARTHALRFAALLMMIGSATAFAGDVFVACHDGVTIAPADVRDVFLGEKRFAGAVRLVPVDNGAAQAEFLDKVLKMNGARYANTWTKKSFRDGVFPPAVKASDAEVLEFIRRTPGGCGYLSTEPHAGVTLIGTY